MLIKGRTSSIMTYKWQKRQERKGPTSKPDFIYMCMELPIKARRCRHCEGKTMGKTSSSAAEVHKHKAFSTASSGKSGLFPGVMADSRGCTAASTSGAASPPDYCSADVPSARLQ